MFQISPCVDEFDTRSLEEYWYDKQLWTHSGYYILL